MALSASMTLFAASLSYAEDFTLMVTNSDIPAPAELMPPNNNR